MIFLSSEEDTLASALKYAKTLHLDQKKSLCIYLYGELGAGKTTWVRGMLRGFGFLGKVKSPSYSIVESYPCHNFLVHHFDLYRLSNPSEWQDRGLDEYFECPALSLIEWPDHGGNYVPKADISIYLSYQYHGQQEGRGAVIS
jgi:tRNA threonylcarbamoyladenosine biosynthesis protein TsaE